ncbi:hypothetical protein sscle_11g083190 [Sclerotinia sclerotiorum 1980 UF-70]|uniref:Uncharacterized protein n=1 Tax=Sclerotinia sclerotiorum (strain ATCC 18683 / 1980 / Ss-1) TaxID=665079 RepID=A0A1D9QF80_SCLS1|nr:hypothetical protein sscle_11g083190 [Sclerotinia sclerotiorum 1980 UF-70]
MERYPTPPSTSSPKHKNHGYHNGHNTDERNAASRDTYGKAATAESYISQNEQAQDKKSGIYSSFTDASTIVPASTEAWASGHPAPSKPTEVHDFYGITSQDPSYNIPNQFSGPPPSTDYFKTASQDPRAKSHSYSYNDNSQRTTHRPAQETYWQTTSNPDSPSQTRPMQILDPRPYPEDFDPAHPTHPGPPPRRSSSPIPNTLPSIINTNPYSQPPQQPPHPQPIRRRSSPIPGRITSPFKKPLSPFSLSRPKPRPGFIKRVTHRIKSWIQSLFSWTRANPIKAGLLSFIPVLLGAGIVKTVKGVKYFLGRGADKVKEKKNKLGKGIQDARKAQRKWVEDVLGDFRGFAGAKGGPFNGILRIVHMLLNHYCRLSPSNYPRAASILLELYFLDLKTLS